MRWDVLNAIASTIGANRYLEIGLADGDTFDQIKCAEKFGVDPDMRRYLAKRPFPRHSRLYRITSDEFFAQTHEQFDLIFVDGLHDCEQTRRDCEHALTSLRSGGVIVLHDTLPPDARYVTPQPTLISRAGNALWCGDIWRIFQWLWSRPDLRFRTVQDDYGCTVVWPGVKAARRIETSWEWFDSNRADIAAIVSLPPLLKELRDAS